MKWLPSQHQMGCPNKQVGTLQGSLNKQVGTPQGSLNKQVGTPECSLNKQVGTPAKDGSPVCPVGMPDKVGTLWGFRYVGTQARLESRGRGSSRWVSQLRLEPLCVPTNSLGTPVTVGTLWVRVDSALNELSQSGNGHHLRKQVLVQVKTCVWLMATVAMTAG